MASVKKLISNVYMKTVLKKEKELTIEGCSLKYLFIKKKKSNRLLVVFSGFPPENKKGGYNYVLKFRELKCNKLYILDDFGNDFRGSYYLGENKDFFIERAVSQLVEKISFENGIGKQNITTAGTSKGGYAALYFAFKNNYGKVISGAPQILLGNYLIYPPHQNILSYITGGKREEDVAFLNDVLLDVIKSSELSPKLYLHVSKNDHHYEDHMIPLLNLLNQKGYNYNLDLAEYENHGDVGRHFPAYARSCF